MIESALSELIKRIEDDNYGLSVGFRIVSFKISDDGEYELVLKKANKEEVKDERN